MDLLLFAFPLLATAIIFVLWIGYLEATDRSPSIVAVLLGVLIVDATLYPSQNEVPTGLFHPVAGGVSFRLIDVAIPAALVARLATRGFPERLSVRGILWGCFFVWVLAAASIGLYNGNTTDLVTFEAKVVLYLGAMVLAGGTDLRRYVEEGHLLRWARVSAAVCALLILTHATGVRLAFDVPGIPLNELGRMGSDAATIFASLGLVAATMGAFSAHGRSRYLIPAAPLMVAGVATAQRAALLGLAAALLVLLAFSVASRSRLRVTPTEISLVTLALVALVIAPTISKAAAGDDPKLPYQGELATALYGREKQLSAQDRINQWQEARGLVAERPLLGWGLGKEYYFYEPGFREFQKINLTHNIFADLLLRTGAAGLFLFLLALGLSLLEGSRSVFVLRDDVVAAAALGFLAVVVGLVAKGMTESIFEKYRLATLLGLSLGMLAAGSRARAADQSEPAP